MKPRGRIIGLGILVLLVVAGALALILPGSRDDPVRLGAVAAAAEATSQLEGMRMWARFEMPMEPGGPSVPFTMVGKTDLKAGQGTLRADMTEVRAATARAEDMTRAQSAALGAPREWRLKMVFDDPLYYMHWPLLAELYDKKSPWFVDDMRDDATRLGLDAGAFQSVSGTDPRQFLEFLRATGEVEEVGSDVVRGARTTHYRTRVEFEELAERVPEDEREDTREAMQRVAEALGEDGFDTEVWVDERNYVRRIDFELAYDTPQEQGALSGRVEFYDFGIEVREPRLPDREDASDIDKLEVE